MHEHVHVSAHVRVHPAMLMACVHCSSESELPLLPIQGAITLTVTLHTVLLERTLFFFHTIVLSFDYWSCSSHGKSVKLVESAYKCQKTFQRFFPQMREKLSHIWAIGHP